MVVTSVPETRAHRGIALYRERRDEILHLSGQEWIVPSATDSERRYVVDLEAQSDDCGDRPPEGEVCKHVVAAAIARAKSARCGGCGERFPRRLLVELHEDNHDNLTHFHGEKLCPGCCDRAGVLR